MHTYLQLAKKEIGFQSFVRIRAHKSKVQNLIYVTSGKYKIIPASSNLRVAANLGNIPTYYIDQNGGLNRI
jgi:hypothetical protein